MDPRIPTEEGRPKLLETPGQAPLPVEGDAGGIEVVLLHGQEHSGQCWQQMQKTM